MSQGSSTDYYRSRERQERAVAAACIDPGIAAIHTELADRYCALTRDAASPAVPRLNLRAV